MHYANWKDSISKLIFHIERENVIMSSQFKPSTGYKERVIESFSRQGMMKTINASILAIRPGEIELEFPYKPNLTQQHGFIRE